MSDRRGSLPHRNRHLWEDPYVEDLATLDADVGILGVPTDAAGGMRPGCRHSPRAIRDASTRFGFLGRARPDGYFDVNQGRTLLRGVRIADCGDADVTTYDVERNVAIVEDDVRRILGRGALLSHRRASVPVHRSSSAALTRFRLR